MDREVELKEETVIAAHGGAFAVTWSYSRRHSKLWSMSAYIHSLSPS